MLDHSCRLLAVVAVQKKLVFRGFGRQLAELPPLHYPASLADERDALAVVAPRTEAAQLRDLQVGVGPLRRGPRVPAPESGTRVQVRSNAEETQGPHCLHGGA
eukprot:10107136-Alexandrium_andersonii.AAC.1